MIKQTALKQKTKYIVKIYITSSPSSSRKIDDYTLKNKTQVSTRKIKQNKQNNSNDIKNQEKPAGKKRLFFLAFPVVLVCFCFDKASNHLTYNI